MLRNGNGLQVGSCLQVRLGQFRNEAGQRRNRGGRRQRRFVSLKDNEQLLSLSTLATFLTKLDRYGNAKVLHYLVFLPDKGPCGCPCAAESPIQTETQRTTK